MLKSLLPESRESNRPSLYETQGDSQYRGIAQVGWLQQVDPNGNTVVTGFAEQDNLSGQLEFQHFYSGPYYGQLLPGNQVVFTPASKPGLPDIFYYREGGNQRDSWVASFVPDAAENFAESHTIASAMPGTTHDGGEQFQGVGVWTGVAGGSGSWVNFAGTYSALNGSGNGVKTGDYWGMGFDNPANPQTHIWGWDWACS